ncbi:hypothetical protein NKG05_08275 [Oerskovia sp. M15]
MNTLPAPMRELVEKAYGDGIADIFLVAVPLAVIGLVCVLFLKEVPLGHKSGLDERLERELSAA